MNRWKPENGEMYWYVWNDGNACWGNFTGVSDERRFKSGNCFKTEAEAEAAAEKVKALLLSLHGECENLQPTCNQLATNLQHDELPKLTTKVFDRPDCPAEATFAIVYQDGSASYMKGDPAKMKSKEMYWSYTLSSGIENLGEIPGKFDPSDWKNSLVERPAKPPEWCKVGEWVYTCGCDYRKVEAITDGIVCLSGGLNIPVGDIHSELVKARLRPYDGDEIPDLPFEVTERNSNFRTTVVSCQGNNVWLGGASTAISTEELMRDFTAKGEPCGTLEHFEAGKWVK